MDIGGEPVNIHIFEFAADEANQPSARASATRSLLLADGIFLVYDVTCRNSLELLKDTMLNAEVLGHLCRATHVLVVGAKNDTEGDKKRVSAQEGKAFADKIGAGFVETSGREGKNVSKALFLMMVTLSESRCTSQAERRSRRLKMPWTDPVRLREALEENPQRTNSSDDVLGLDMMTEERGLLAAGEGSGPYSLSDRTPRK
ncbi:unnamed protein product [Ascophyllum nodosum]